MKNPYIQLAALAFLVGSTLIGFTSQAQVFGPLNPPNSPITPSTPTVVRPDTAETREVVVSPAEKKNKSAADSAKRTEHMFRAFGYKGIRLTRPGKAALLAALLPGAGQIYNRSYWKLPLVYAALGGTIYGEYFYQKGYREFADAVNLIEAGKEVPGGDLLESRAKKVRSLDGLRTGVVFYRGNRDIFYLYIGIAYSLQIVDALVDAHLKDFDVSDDLTFHWEPTMMAVPGQATAFPTAPGVLFALRLK